MIQKFDVSKHNENMMLNHNQAGLIRGTCTINSKSCIDMGQNISHQKMNSLDFLSAIQNVGVYLLSRFFYASFSCSWLE